MLNVDNIGQLSRVLTRVENLPNVLEARLCVLDNNQEISQR